jgi:hypothetical protein
VEEVWQRLKSDFREYRKLTAAHGDTAPVQLAILFDAGWLGHYVADGSQPLHNTIQYNGWTGPNPHHYTTEHHIHAQFESIFVSANIQPADVAPLVAAAQPTVIDDEWTQYWNYLHHSNSLVEKVYQLEKAGGFTDPGTPEAKAFTEERLAAGAIELRDLINSAWVHSADPVQEYRGPSRRCQLSVLGVSSRCQFSVVSSQLSVKLHRRHRSTDNESTERTTEN